MRQVPQMHGEQTFLTAVELKRWLQIMLHHNAFSSTFAFSAMRSDVGKADLALDI